MEMKDSRHMLEVGFGVYDNNLEEEMRELRKLRTTVMVEKCLNKNEGIICPKPRRQYPRQGGENSERKNGAELLDFISKGSPPYYSGSPPIRASNPLIQDACFREQRVSSSSIHANGVDIVERNRRTRSIPTMA